MINEQTRSLRAFVVGCGRRVQNNFLPALRCLKENYTVVGLHSRTAERLLPVAEHWQVPPVLKDIDLSGIDVVIMSVPTGQNAAVLQKFISRAAELTVVIDTPVAALRSELVTTQPLLAQFKRVIVTEDYMNFPCFALMRKAVQGGLIGDLRGVTLYNIGFQYHGLALVRSFNGFRPAHGSWRKSVGTFSNVIGYDFGRNSKAMIVGPYRRHTTGGITVEGTGGILTNFQGDAVFGSPRKRPVYTLTEHRENGVIDGYSLEGADDNYQVDLPAAREMAAMDFSDKSDLNLQRGCGLIQVLKSAYEVDTLNSSYGFTNAFYDSFVPRLAARGVLPFDPLVPFGSDAMKLITTVSRWIA